MDEKTAQSIGHGPEYDFVLKTIKSRDVHFVRCWFSDVLGNMKSFAVVPDELEYAFESGMGFDGSCIQGFLGEGESDMLAFPDPSTFQVLPWRPESNAVARMFCDIRMPDGSQFEGDPRYILKKVTDKASQMGYSMAIGPELEFFYFSDANSTTPLDQGTYFDLTTLDYASDLRRDTVLTLEKMGIPVEYSHHEAAPSQHEIDLRYNDALPMADAVMTYRLVVKEIANKHGVYASFMPKPLQGQQGNGMHVHQSLFDLEGRNAFFDESDPMGLNLSKVAKSYMAGLLKYSREYCLITNQYVNSFKRLDGSPSAPRVIGWGRNNRTTILRVPGYRPSKPDSCRIELRNPDPAANPYLAFATMLAAGLRGIEENLELEPAIDESKPARAHDPSKLLPETFGDAIRCFEESQFMKETLGEHTHGYIVSAKKRDLEEYRSIVTKWELDKYLAVL